MSIMIVRIVLSLAVISVLRIPFNKFLVTKVTNPEGNSTQFSYDPRGNLTSVTDALNNKTMLDRNLDDRTVRAITRQDHDI